MNSCTSKALKKILETDINKTLKDFSSNMSKTPDFSGVLGQCFREKIFSNSENGVSVENAKEALEAIKMDFESAYNLIKDNPDFAKFKKGIERLLSDIDKFLSGDQLSKYVSTANTESNTEVSTIVVKSELVDADPGFKFEIQEGSIFSNIFGESSQAKTKLRKAFEDRMFKCVTRYTDLSGETRYVKTLEELNENITKYKEEWYKILKEGANLKDETLYNEDGDSNFNSAMSDAKSALNPVLEKIDTLEFGESYMLGNNKLVNAAVAYYVLNNFDAFVIETTKFNRSKI